MTTDPTHGLSVQHADALWDAVAIPGPRSSSFPAQHERVCRAVAEILAVVTAVPESEPSVGRAALRDRIADVLRTTPSAIGAENPQLGFPSHHQPGEGGYLGWCALCVRDIDALTDAVLAVLPAPADQAAEIERLRTMYDAATAREHDLIEERDELRAQANLDQLAEAVLPAPADRAAVLREAADWYAQQGKLVLAASQVAADLRRRADVELRRMADAEPPAAESSPDVDPVYDPRAWETYRRDTGCGCTAPAPVNCKVPHGTGAWLCVCHRLSGPPSMEPGKPLFQQDASIRQFFQEPNRCTSTDGIFRCARPTGHAGDHRTGRTFWGRRAEDDEHPASPPARPRGGV